MEVDDNDDIPYETENKRKSKPEQELATLPQKLKSCPETMVCIKKILNI